MASEFDRKLKTLFIGHDVLLGLLRAMASGDQITMVRIPNLKKLGIPDSATIVSAFQSQQRYGFEFVIRDESFPEVDYGADLPPAFKLDKAYVDKIEHPTLVTKETEEELNDRSG